VKGSDDKRLYSQVTFHVSLKGIQPAAKVFSPKTIMHVLKIPNIFSILENTRFPYTSYSANKENFLNNQNIVSKALLIFTFR